MEKIVLAIANLTVALKAAGKTDSEIKTITEDLMRLLTLTPIRMVRDTAVLINRVNSVDTLTGGQKTQFINDLN